MYARLLKPTDTGERAPTQLPRYDSSITAYVLPCETLSNHWVIASSIQLSRYDFVTTAHAKYPWSTSCVSADGLLMVPPKYSMPPPDDTRNTLRPRGAG